MSSTLIHSDQPREKESMVPMELFLNKSNQLNFIGKGFSSRNVADQEQAYYEIEVPFSDLADKDRAMLKKFIDYQVSAPNPDNPEAQRAQ